MFKQDFKTSELKAALEDGLGFALRSLTRISGGRAINFRAALESDGLLFLVKCRPSERRQAYGALVENLREEAGEIASIRLLVDENARLNV